MAAEVLLYCGAAALVDDNDLALVGRYRWRLVRDATTCYASRTFRLPDGRKTTQSMHRLITGYRMTDHVNGNGLDNRRSNLRPADHHWNGANRRKSHGTSQFKGVCWHRKAGAWQAAIQINGRKCYLGIFPDEMAAALAYDNAARKHFGQFAAVNIPATGERSALTGEIVGALG